MIHTGIRDATVMYRPIITIHAVLLSASPTFSPITREMTIPASPITVAGPVFIPTRFVRIP